MTCIIGKLHDGKVYMAGDSAASGTSDRLIFAHQKVFRMGDMLIGVCGSNRVLQLIRYELELSRSQNEGEPDEQYLVKVFAKEVQALFASRNITGKDGSDEETFYGGVLIGYHGRLYHMFHNYQLDQYRQDYGAMGSGAPYALGAYAALKQREDDPTALLCGSLEIAATLCSEVGAPFYIEVL